MQFDDERGKAAVATEIGRVESAWLGPAQQGRRGTVMD